jgi:hypothetical protein
MPAVVVVAAAAATGVAAAIGTAAVAAITTATISAAAATAIGTGIIAGGITAIQGGSTSDVLKSAVIAGIGSYVGGQVASKVTNSVSAATGGTNLGSGLTPGAAGTTGLTAGAAGTGLSAGAAAGGSTASTFITPTALGFTAGQVAGRSVQAAITGQDIGEAALFGLASGVPLALNQSADFRSLDNTTKSVITASVQSAVMGQDVPEAAVSALVQSSNIVAKGIREIPGGDQFIRENPNYARYVIDSVSSALTAELLNKDVSDAVINSLARTTGQLLASEFENSQREKEISETQQAYGRLEQKERELVMVQEQIQAVQENPRYAKFFKKYAEAANDLASAQDAYQNQTQQISRLEREWDNASESQRSFIEYQYKQAVDWANYFASVYNSKEQSFQVYRENLADSGYFKEFGKLEKQYNEIQREYDSIANSISNITTKLAKTSADLFTETSRQTLSEIERLAEAGDVQMPSDADQFAEGMRIDVTGTASILFKTPDDRFAIFENLALIDSSKDFNDPAYRIQLTPEEFRDITGMDYQEALASNRVAVGELGGAETPVEDIAGIPSFTGTPALEAAALPFVVGVDLRKEVSPQAPVGTAIYRPADVSGTTGSGSGTSSTFQIIGRDRATGAEKVDVDGEGFTLIALPDNRQALVKDVGQVVLYPERDPVTNDVVLRPEPNPEIALKIISDASGGGGGGATQAPAPDNDRTGGAPSPSSQVLARQANQRALNRVLDMELAKLESQLQQAEAERYESEIALQRVLEQRGRFGNFVQVGGGQRPVTSTNARLSPETQRALEEEIGALESQLSESSRQIEDATAERERFGALQQRTQDLSDEDILSFLESGEIPGGRGEGEPGAVGGLGGDQEGVDGGTGGGRGGGAGAGEGDGTGPGAGGGEGDLVPDVTLDEGLPRATVSLGPEIPTRSETLPFASRVTGEALEGILGEKEPLFGGDDDEQRAVWNRRSLKLLSRALGL